jgi:hypothetical protein
MVLARHLAAADFSDGFDANHVAAPNADALERADGSSMTAIACRAEAIRQGCRRLDIHDAPVACHERHVDRVGSPCAGCAPCGSR